MSTFPLLKTGAVTQMPASRSLHFSTDVVQFLDGTEQRYPSYSRPYYRWMVNLDGLNETELQNIRAFVQQMDGSLGLFSFSDPWDGTIYPACSFEGEAFAETATGPLQCATKLVIRENRL